MARFVSWIRKEIGLEAGGPVPAIWQYVFHLIVIYAVARYCVLWLAWGLHDYIFPVLLRHGPKVSSFEFFFSNLIDFSVICGLLAGFINGNFMRHPVVRFTWAVPVLILVLAFLFKVPGVYPTMIFQSDFGAAFHYAFGGGFKIPHDFRTRRELWAAFSENPDMLRGYFQFRYAAPAYASVAYSLGALLSTHLKNLRVADSAAGRATI